MKKKPLVKPILPEQPEIKAHVTLSFCNDGMWHIEGVGISKKYVKYKAARAAMDDYYYSTPWLANS